jgi:hypothetical protein
MNRLALATVPDPAAGPVELEFEWVRNLGEPDFAAMLALLNEVALTTGTNGFAAPLSELETARLRAKLSASLECGEAYQLLVRLAGTGQVVGIATLETMSQPTRRHIVEIRRAAIGGRYRGRFLRRAWAAIIDKCHEMGWELIQIDVSEDGPVKLWESYGFRTFGRVADYARIGARRLDGFFMIHQVAAPERDRNGGPLPPRPEAIGG